MIVATPPKTWSDQEFMALSKDGHRYEIVDGELVDMGNSGMELGNLGTYLGGLIELYVRPKRLGVTCDSSTAFKLKSGNRRSPDISFIAKAQLQGLDRGRLPTGCFDNGTRLVWVIHPDEQFILIYHSTSPDRLLTAEDRLDGEEVIPGFSCPLKDLFMKWEFD
jgi:Uma2 family endonuclease